MFKNVGKKIKTLAIIMFIVFMIITTALAFLATYLLISIDNDVLWVVLAVLAFILIEAIGTFISWISVLKQYAFGELVDANQIQVKQNNIIIELLGGEKIDLAGFDPTISNSAMERNGRHYTYGNFGAMDIPKRN